MKILERQKLNIKKKYILIAAIVLSLIIVLQMSSTATSNTLKIALSDVVFFITNYCVWVLMLEYIYGAVKPLNFSNKWNTSLVFSGTISLTILAFIHLIITNVIYYSFVIFISNISVLEAFQSFQPYILKSIFSRFLDLAIIVILLKIIQTYLTVQKQKLQVLSLENELNTAQLETLRWQLNPHFLFNSLHTLNTLIGYDDERAQEMIIKITNLLRKMLSQKEVHLITFKEELEYFKNYLEIEQERFYDRLEVSVEVDEKTNDILVPTLILQPLIENAFKHGISRIEGKGIIDLKATILGRELVIKINNSIPKENSISKEKSTKIGLQNLRNRLDKVFGENYTFSTEKGDKLFTATLIINQIN
mgnify:CR=1 FL=1